MVNVHVVTVQERLLEASKQKENFKSIADTFDEKTCEVIRKQFAKARYKYLVYTNTRLIAGNDDVIHLSFAISEYLKHRRSSTIVVIEKETKKVFGCFYGFIG